MPDSTPASSDGASEPQPFSDADYLKSEVDALASVLRQRRNEAGASGSPAPDEAPAPDAPDESAPPA